MRRFGLMAAAGAAALTSMLGAAPAAHAGGFYLQEQGVRATGRAYSGEAADQGVESLWWNPASIAGSGTEVYAGVNGILTDGSVTDLGSTLTLPVPPHGLTLPVGGDPHIDHPIENGVAPNLAGAYSFGGRFAVGLSVAGPYNFTTAYPGASFTRYDALKSRLFTADGQLTLAMRATSWLDLGVAADAEYSDAKLTNALPNLAPGAPDGAQSLTGHGWNWGWTAGAQAHFGAVSLGASYRSAIGHDLKGTVSAQGLLGPLAAANFVAPGSAHFTTPWIATFGVRYHATDRLTFDAQVQRFGWSEFSAITVASPAGLQVLPQGYRDTTSGAFGLDYDVSPKLTLRTGFQYDPTPVPQSGPDARVPDSDRWILAAGASAKLNRRMTLDAAFAYINFQPATINHDADFFAGTPAATSAHTIGAVEGTGYVVSLGFRAAL